MFNTGIEEAIEKHGFAVALTIRIEAFVDQTESHVT